VNTEIYVVQAAIANTLHPRGKRVIVLLKSVLASVCLSLSSSIVCRDLL
jgi:hypothetical protein